MALKPRKGISSPIVTNIPQQWSAEWFRGFITRFLNDLDTRNAIPAQGITVTGTPTVPATIGQSNTSSTTLSPIPNNNVLGNTSGSTASPVAVSAQVLTEVLSTFTNTAQGVVPPSGGGTVNFMRADGTWANPGTGGSPGPTGPAGPAGPPLILMWADEPEEPIQFVVH